MLNRLSAVLLASCLALPVMTVSASAESQIRQKKFNFNSGSSTTQSNDSFWSQRQKRSRQRQRARQDEERFNFLDRTRGFFSRSGDYFDRQVRYRNARRYRERVRLSDNDGPDAASTGEKYHKYKASYPVVLAGKKLKQPRPKGAVFASASGTVVDANEYVETVQLPDPLAQAVFETLKQGSAGASLSKSQVKALVAAYAEREFEPIWITDRKPSSNARAVLKVLANADQEGLDPDLYRLASLTDAGSIDDLASDPEALAKFELQLSAMALRYSDHAASGLVTPNKISGYHDLKPPKIAAKDAVASLVNHPAPQDWLMSLHPKLPAYAAMKAELIKLGAGEPEVDQIVVPAGPLLKLGVEDDRVPILRERLKQLKLLKNKDELALSDNQASDAPLFGSDGAVLAAENASDTMTETDVKALRAFQKSVGLSPDGIAGRRTINALNGKKSVRRTDQIALNMERLRWLPRNLGSRYVLVNQPAYKMQIINKGETEWSTRVIVGKPSNQTYFFSDQMSRVEFNPYWGIPQSIIKGEYLRRVQDNPSYFEQRGYEVLNSRGQRISGWDVDWWNYRGGIGVRQKPGPKNALGEVKFMFPNKHAIYLHDTPKRSLFSKDRRAYSHGCVRVQNPRELATQILGWSQNKIASTIATRKNTPVQLKRKLPVHLTYFTAWTDETGDLAYYNDVYKRDMYLARALKAEKTALR
ncbi:L,D-transpeptidase family protein [Anderseniella sp. Alg231-50]|uniref:L,D-transpeptidase family protein n=1 Tax=Anderseniella sp. Alg231-50 TaxID=1922226 RepID=UPI000D562419